MQKVIIATLLAALLAGTALYFAQEDPADLRIVYEQWKVQHGKKLSNSEDNYRFEVFKRNAQIVEEHNRKFQQGLETHELGLNVFADLTLEEFEANYLTRIPTPRRKVVANQARTLKDTPTSVDHRQSGIVSPVQDQGQCGGCWAFSAVGSLESALRQSGKKDVQLSEQEIIDCATGEDYQSIGCDGGYSKDGIIYASRQGVAIKSEYPYTGTDGNCKRDKTKTRHRVAGYFHVTQQDASAFVEAAAIKPLSAAINASGANFQFYKSGIYSKACNGAWEKLNHEIVVVGYAPDYYIIKNSWGEKWGEQGYIRFARISNPEGQCGVQQDAGYPQI